jgi:drug/metabolite transporter (DMT)-like permease
VTSVLYVRAVSLSPLSLTIPYLGLTPVVSLVVAMLLINEVPSSRGLFGIIFVVIGAFALHLGKDITLKALVQAPFREPGSWRMIIVAVTWGITTSLDKIAIQHGSEALLGLFLTLGSALILIFSRSLRSLMGDGESLTDGNPYRQPLLLLAAFVAGLAVLSQFYAYRYLLVAYVESIKRAGGVLSALIGILFFAEEGFVVRIPAAVLILIGSTLVLI